MKDVSTLMDYFLPYARCSRCTKFDEKSAKYVQQQQFNCAEQIDNENNTVVNEAQITESSRQTSRTDTETASSVDTYSVDSSLALFISGFEQETNARPSFYPEV